MNIEQLIEEGRQLIKPCIYLTQDDQDAPLAAIWGGSPLAPLPDNDDDSLRHWLSLDCRFLPEGYKDLKGCLSIYADDAEEGGVVNIDHSRRLDSSHASGIPLYAHSVDSWPSIDAVFKYGSPKVKEWVADCGWQTNWFYNGSFKGHAVASIYEEYVWEKNLLSQDQDDVFARLGGWHDSWPEGDWFNLLEKKLVAFTYRDAEPWIEVWVDKEQQFEVIQRIT